MGLHIKKGGHGGRKDYILGQLVPAFTPFSFQQKTLSSTLICFTAPYSLLKGGEEGEG